MMYEEFATVYDVLMADVDYPGWASFYAEIAREKAVIIKQAVDCACGTGSLSLAMAVSGIAVTGIDNAPRMLEIAAEKARARGLRVPFIRQDIRKLRLHRPVDAVFCACDGVNYLTHPQGVQAFFQAAYQALRPGGGLFFDISTEYKLEHRLGGNCLGEDGEAVSYLWQNHYDRGARQLQMDLTFFVRERDGRYARFTETHSQRAHTAEELVEWLSGAGFRDVSIYGDRELAPPHAFAERIHIAALRPSD
ncbi:class I SAM-dependent methyltransferase [Eubacteriales bacterium OttesenSCG-928-A19]|nr:class I SAM-dependent methyltransferase [Eubacteriales bacterium OttesenSCG-928-A19]